jgi:hypothetical protein
MRGAGVELADRFDDPGQQQSNAQELERSSLPVSIYRPSVWRQSGTRVISPKITKIGGCAWRRLPIRGLDRLQ